MPMTRRSLNTTTTAAAAARTSKTTTRTRTRTSKSGKYVRNLTDQARKEARKREVMKNKKRRIALRQAILKSKDALQLLEEASMYDKQEYDWSVQSSQLNEHVLQAKRKRLLETFDKIVCLYKKEDPEYAKDLVRARKVYDKCRYDMMLYYEQVKLAERAKASTSAAATATATAAAAATGYTTTTNTNTTTNATTNTTTTTISSAFESCRYYNANADVNAYVNADDAYGVVLHAIPQQQRHIRE